MSIYLDESLCISDGTHAAAALQNFGTAKAYAKMQIVKGLSDTDLVDVADALNMSKRIKLFNLENKRGKFDWLNDLLQEVAEDVIFFEGTRYYPFCHKPCTIRYYHCRCAPRGRMHCVESWLSDA